MIELYSPHNEPELAVIKTILDAEGIHYFVRNDHFGSMEVGPKIELFNAKTILVAAEHYDRGKELISAFLITPEDKGTEDRQRYTLFDKLRMAFEVILFMWIMPGRRSKKRDKEQTSPDNINGV